MDFNTPHLERLKFVAAAREPEFVMKVKEVKHNEKIEDSMFSTPSD